jgi:hypothetical protein
MHFLRINAVPAGGVFKIEIPSDVNAEMLSSSGAAHRYENQGQMGLPLTAWKPPRTTVANVRLAVRGEKTRAARRSLFFVALSMGMAARENRMRERSRANDFTTKVLLLDDDASLRGSARAIMELASFEVRGLEMSPVVLNTARTGRRPYDRRGKKGFAALRGLFPGIQVGAASGVEVMFYLRVPAHLGAASLDKSNIGAFCPLPLVVLDC